MKELKDVAKKASAIVGGRIIGQGLDLITILIITRFIGAEIYGRFIFVLALLNFVPVFANVGMTNGLLAIIPKYIVNKETEKRNSVISFSLLVSFSLSLICVILVYLFIHKLGYTLLQDDSYYETLLLIMAPITILNTMNALMKFTLRGLGGVKYFVYSTNIVMPISRMASVIILILMSFKMEALILSMYISLILVWLYLFSGLLKYKLLAPIRIKYVSEYTGLIKFSIPLMLSGGLGIIITQMDTVMIGYFLRPTDVAVYRIVAKLATITGMILTSFNIAYAPKISELYHKGEIKEIESLYKTITRWAITIGLLIFGFTLIDGGLILSTIFGKEYEVGSMALIIMSFGQFINSGTGSVGQLCVMTGYSMHYFYSQIFNMVLKVGLNLALIPLYGINGVALAAMFCLSSVNLLRMLIVYLNLKIHPFEKDMIKSIMVIIGSAIVVFCLKPLINNGLKKLLFDGAIYVTVFIILMLLLGISSEDKQILQSVKKSVVSKVKRI